jgi:hypothetical protein
MLADDFHDPTKPKSRGGRGEVTRPAEQGWIRFAWRFKTNIRATNKKKLPQIFGVVVGPRGMGLGISFCFYLQLRWI